MLRTGSLWTATVTLTFLMPLPIVTAEASTPTKCFGYQATITGTPGDDHLRGTNRPDVILGLAGDDIIDGWKGDDLICGNGGRDVLTGGPGKDKLSGGLGHDNVFDDGAGRDVVYLGPGSDTWYGGPGDDVIVAGPGNDVLHPWGAEAEPSDHDRIDGGPGEDWIGFVLPGGGSFGSVRINLGRGSARGEEGWVATLEHVEDAAGAAGGSVLIGDDGPNQLSSARFERGDVLRGGRGNDVLIPDHSGVPGQGIGQAHIHGGRGRDMVSFLGNPVHASLREGLAHQGSGANSGVSTLDGIEAVRGSNGHDVLIGDGSGNLLVGRGGDDRIRGLGGLDTLSGNRGNDSLNGGSGTDSCRNGEVVKNCE
jgi:Ca2+-binding RTX toxin-like protein